MASVRVLLIDDEADTLLPTLAQDLEPMGFEFRKETNAARALRSVGSIKPDVILLDLHFPGDERHGGRTTGGKLLTAIRRHFASIPVVVFTTRLDDPNIPLEVFEEQPHGRFAKPDFAGKCEWTSALARTLRDAVGTVRSNSNSDADNLGFLVGQTKEMRVVADMVRMAGRSTLNVLIYGETGTGKELAAKAIHDLSDRKGRFEHFNCSGVHPETLESTLFGHERGAFTGANTAREGLFELANEGTLFLDEIQGMPMFLQNNLMLIVESGQVRRMGATRDKQVDVRLIVATNHNLSDLVADGVLREDLAQRLTCILLSLPPLRKRQEDLPELFKVFVDKANITLDKSVLDVLRPETLSKLQSYDWPGNIRELETTIARAVATTTSNVLLPEDIVFTELVRRRSVLVEEDAPNVSNTSPTAGATTDHSNHNHVVTALTDHLESLPVEERYPFLRKQSDQLRGAVLIEFIRRLRQQTGQRVTHEFLAAKLDPLSDRKKDLARIRQFVTTGCKVKLTALECNQ